MMVFSIVPVAFAEEAIFETVRPEVDVVPGQSVTVMVKTPSGRNVSIGIKISGMER